MSHDHELKRRVLGLLSSLGGTRAAVAGSLIDARVTGTPGNAEHCPIASYLHAVLGAEPSVRSLMVGTRRLLVVVEGRRRPLRITMPRAVRDFVVAFDTRAYPGLVRATTVTSPSRSAAG